MKAPVLFWSVGAATFCLTFVISARENHLWPLAEPNTARAALPRQTASPAVDDSMLTRPFGRFRVPPMMATSAGAPPPSAIDAAPVAVAPDATPGEPSDGADADQATLRVRADRGAERGARSH